VSERTSHPAPDRLERRYHIHVPGFVYVGVVLFLAIGAINSQNNLLFAALGLGIGGLLVSGALSGAALMGVRASRDPVGVGRAGEPIEIVYRVRNLARRLPAFGLRVEEDGAAYERGEPVRCAVFLEHVRARGSALVRGSLTPPHRGVIRLPAVRVWTTFPFGLTKKSVRIPQDDALLVLPVVHELRSDVLASLRSRAATGTGSRPTPGLSEDFYGVREYIAGDSPRRIAWRASARVGTLVVRQDSTPTPARVWIVLAAAPDAASEAVERAVSLAASLMARGDRDGLAMGFATLDGAITHPPRLGRPHLHRVLTDLATWRPDASASVAMPASATRSGACIVVHAGHAPSAIPPSARVLSGETLPELIAVREASP